MDGTLPFRGPLCATRIPKQGPSKAEFKPISLGWAGGEWALPGKPMKQCQPAQTDSAEKQGHQHDRVL